MAQKSGMRRRRWKIAALQSLYSVRRMTEALVQIKSRMRTWWTKFKRNTEQRITVKTVMSLLSFLRIWTDCRWYDFCTVLLSVRRGNDFRLFLAVEHFTKKRLNSPHGFAIFCVSLKSGERKPGYKGVLYVQRQSVKSRRNTMPPEQMTN